jgi:hypothetical protein
MLESNLEHSRKRLGDNHLDTLSCYDALAVAYGHLHRFEDAIPLVEHTYRAKQKSLGENHSQTAVSRYNLSVFIGNALKLNRLKNQPEASELLIDNLMARYLDRGEYALAYISARQGTVDQLDRLIQQSVERDHEAGSTALDARVLGDLRLMAGRPSHAISAILAGITREASQGPGFLSLACAFLAQGESTQSKEAFRNVLATCRQDDGSYNLEKADVDQLTAAYFLDLLSQSEFVDRLKDNPKHGCVPWFYIGQRKLIENDKTAAIDAYRRCVEIGSNSDIAAPPLARWRLQTLGERKY